MPNSFFLTPEYFEKPEDKLVARETGIEDRYKRAFIATDEHFSLYKDDYSDGLLRYIVNDNVLFYGVQECKLAKTSDVFMSRIVQGLAYISDWASKFPKTLSKFKILILPTEKKIDLIYVEDLLQSAFWTEFKFYYSEHRRKTKMSASNFYKNSPDVAVLIREYIDRIPKSCYEIGKKLDLKIVTEEILKNCL